MKHKKEIHNYIISPKEYFSIDYEVFLELYALTQIMIIKKKQKFLKKQIKHQTTNQIQLAINRSDNFT